MIKQTIMMVGFKLPLTFRTVV